MPYVVEVDLSAKVEQWSRSTAAAFSDGIEGSILVDKKVKKAARDWLKTKYPNRSSSFYRYNLLAAFIYILVQPSLSEIEHIAIDKDYPGRYAENQIKSRLFQFFHREKPSLGGGFVSFREVKGSEADILARSIFVGEKKADREISLEEIKAVFEERLKNDRGSFVRTKAKELNPAD